MTREHVLNRPLTAQEQAWRADHRCIWYWGAARATAASQGPRLMGYHLPRDGGGAEMGNDGDD